MLIPVYHEVATLERVLDAVLATPQEREVILVDDGSTDGTRDGDPARRARFTLATNILSGCYIFDMETSPHVARVPPRHVDLLQEA